MVELTCIADGCGSVAAGIGTPKTGMCNWCGAPMTASRPSLQGLFRPKKSTSASRAADWASIILQTHGEEDTSSTGDTVAVVNDAWTKYCLPAEDAVADKPAWPNDAWTKYWHERHFAQITALPTIGTPSPIADQASEDVQEAVQPEAPGPASLQSDIGPLMKSVARISSRAHNVSSQDEDGHTKTRVVAGKSRDLDPDGIRAASMDHKLAAASNALKVERREWLNKAREQGA